MLLDFFNSRNGRNGRNDVKVNIINSSNFYKLHIPLCYPIKFQYNRLINAAITTILIYCSSIFPSQAQIKPDMTLPNNTKIEIEGNIQNIDGGTQIGSNLFHSFDDFSVINGTTVHFNNSLDVQNIITRVTGGLASNIDGLIKANGSANLFLINPSGISFGENARLNIGGSFFATTANTVQFLGDAKFSATNPQAPPLLANNVPIGLGFGDNPGVIKVQGTDKGIISPNIGNSPTVTNSQISGLQVQSGKTLALLGGDITLEGGILAAEGGKVDLGSVASGVVNLSLISENWTLGYEGISNFKNIQLSKQALVDASGTGSGTVQVHGGNVNLTNGSIMLIQNRGETLSGSLNINASESLVLSGASPDGNISSSLLTEALSTGKGGDLKISTPRLILQDGARVGAVTYTDALGGNVTVEASDSVQLLENRFANPYRRGDIISSLGAGTVASGNAGSVELSTNYLLITDGGTIASSTMGTGKGSNITVDANFIDIIGVNSVRSAPSAIAASAFNAGNAGSLFVNTKQLRVTDGGALNSASRATGNAGNVTINADLIEVTGEDSNAGASHISSSIEASNEIVRKIFGLPSVPTGSGGNLTITTKVLNVNQRGLIDVGNQGVGDAGKLEINASSINLNNQGSIAASTISGEGGNIFLDSQNLQLRQNSTVTASAGNNGNGGNITINAGTLTALESSSITANAFEGRGGNIKINTQGFFISPDSIVAASSERGINGSVEIDAPQTDFVTAPLPSSAVTVPDTNDICTTPKENTSIFSNAGSGGVPQSPNDPLNSPAGWYDERNPATNKRAEETIQLTEAEPAQEFVEAQGMKQNADGTIRFTITPDTDNVTSYGSSTDSPCHHSQESSEQVNQQSQEVTNQIPPEEAED
ncbi:hypothetical protein A6770_32795 [Nostoc minutum NIES-26]|uniref:Filamentous haemagglutinin FhaB/tRNA nuclease CdiA-like TPS domain-containing protein n=1 Tax=Nostoc minutum NIES-26 TaxID=1844469 RepID=A0A367Q385_9NOSO|nr:hypothetical protein A6770_32795 [Nostoc minutum NIES-26]